MREPDFIIGDREDPYLLRWHVIPRNKWFNIYLHKFLKSDDDRALHDHPWSFNASILLKGTYMEHTEKGVKRRRRFLPYIRVGKAPHRVELERSYDYAQYGSRASEVLEPCWTLFITGRVVREWGFYCPSGWKHWQAYVKRRPGGNEAGVGCGEPESTAPIQTRPS